MDSELYGPKVVGFQIHKLDFGFHVRGFRNLRSKSGWIPDFINWTSDSKVFGFRISQAKISRIPEYL